MRDWLDDANITVHVSHYSHTLMRMLKNAASDILALLPCSRNTYTLHAPKGLRPCGTNLFEYFLEPLPIRG